MTTPNPSSPRFRLAGPAEARGNLTTWHVCVRTYLDPDLRDFVLNDVYEPLGKPLAPDPAIDSMLVVGHGKRARMINFGVMMTLVALAAVLLVLESPLNRALLIGCFLLWLSLAGIAHRPSAAPSLRMESYTAAAYLLNPLLFKWLFWSAVASLAFGTIFGFAFGNPGWWRVPFELMVLGLVSATGGLIRAACIAAIPKQKQPRSIRGPRHRRMASSQDAEVVTYSGNKLALVGFGEIGALRQIPVPLAAPRGASSPEEVDLELVMKELWAQTEALAVKPEEGEGEPRGLALLTVFNQVFVKDSATREPVSLIEELNIRGRGYDSFSEILKDRVLSVRPYLRIQVIQGEGELVTNLFVRVEQRAGVLVVELVPCRLLPTLECFKLFETGDLRRAPFMCRAGAVGFGTMPLAVFQAPFSLGKSLHRWSMRGKRRFDQWWELQPGGRATNAGIRQESSGEPENSPNEAADAAVMELVLVHHCLKTLRDYLRGKIDVTALEAAMGIAPGQPECQIINNGGSVSIGTVGANGQTVAGAIGSNSKGFVGKLKELLKP